MKSHIEKIHLNASKVNKKRRKKGQGIQLKKVYFCDFCGDKFQLKKTLLPHLYTHLPEQTFECFVCLEKFKDRVVYHSHLNQHKIKNSPFKCQFCDKGFNLKNTKIVHEMSIHGFGNCEVCNFHFKDKKEMKEHLMSHGSFQCSYCGKSFLTPSRLKHHETRHVNMAQEGFGRR